MAKNIFRYLHLFAAIAKYSFVASLQYRFRTIMRIVRIAFEGVLVIIFIQSLFNFAPQVGSWDKNTVLLAFAVAQVVNAVAYFLIASNFEGLGRTINRGELDFILTKPIDAHFYLAFQKMHAQNIFRILLGVGIFIFVINSTSLPISATSFVTFLLLVVSSLVLFISLISLIATISFWTFSSELVDLTNTILSMTRYPLDIFPPRVVTLFTFIPLIFIVTVPTRALLGRIDILTFLSPVIALGVYFASRKFFYFALKHYSLASS